MKHPLGLDDDAWRLRQEPQLCVWDSNDLINGHTLVAGMTGTGKSHNIKRFLVSGAKAGVEIDIFDVHEELDDIPGCVAQKFSQKTLLGFNPLVPNLDEHSGGLRVQADHFVDIINRTGRDLGNRQSAALKNLIRDTYFLRGMYPDSPRSWVKHEITEDQYDELVRRRQWGDLKHYYPTIRDLISLAQRKLKAMSTGGDNAAVSALERVEQTASHMRSVLAKSKPGLTTEEAKKLQDQLDRDKEEAIERYANYINSITTGREFQEHQNYTNAEVLQSLLERLYEMADSGIFLSNPPKWQGSNVRTYQIGSLKDDKRRMLFELRAMQILRTCMDQGKTDEVRHILCADEAHLYHDEDDNAPLNRIAKEGRKFGLMLLLGSQSPTHFTEDFLTSCGTIILLGIHSNFWPMATSKLRCDKKILESVSPHNTMAIKMQRIRQANAKFQLINVNQQTIQEGFRRLRTNQN